MQKGGVGAVNLMALLSDHLQTGNSKGTGKVPRGRKEEAFLICVQEPPVKDNRIVGFDRSHNLFYDCSSRDGPRAAIYSSRNLNVWLLPDFTSRDVTVCVWRTGDSCTPEILVASVYMDITLTSVWPEEFQKLVRYCNDKGKKLIICADTNAHSGFWKEYLS